MPVEGSSDNPVNIGPFDDVVGVTWSSAIPDGDVNIFTQYDPAQSGRMSFSFTGGRVVQTLNLISHGGPPSFDEQGRFAWNLFFPGGAGTITLVGTGPTTTLVTDDAVSVIVSGTGITGSHNFGNPGSTGFTLVLTMDPVTHTITPTFTGPNYS